MDACGLPDLVLIERYNAGDHGAFDVLFGRYESYARNLALRLSGNVDAAADIVSDAFVSVARGLRLFSGRANFRTWLHRIVINSAINYARIQNRRCPCVSLDAFTEDADASSCELLIDDSPSPLELLVRSSVRERVARRMARVPNAAELMMFASDRLTYKEIADVRGLPEGTIKSRINTARKAARTAV